MSAPTTTPASAAHADPADRFVELPSGVTLCYRVDGPDDGVPLVLVAGLSYDLTSWPQRMVDALVARGFRVVRPDNRDVGRSSRMPQRPPTTWELIRSTPVPGSYDLADMAGDVLGLLDHLGIDRAHLVGMSMGGMICQTIAARHPERAASLVSIFSTTGARRVGQPALSTKRRMLRKPARSVEEHVARHLAMLAHIGGRGFPLDEDAERAWARGLWERGHGARDAAANGRQISAIFASGDRTAEVRRITAPTLVVHGDADPLVHPSGGRATHAAIPGSRYVEVAGMGHHLAAPGLTDRLVRLVTRHVATTGAPVRTEEATA